MHFKPTIILLSAVTGLAFAAPVEDGVSVRDASPQKVPPEYYYRCCTASCGVCEGGYECTFNDECDNGAYTRCCQKRGGKRDVSGNVGLLPMEH